MDARGDVWDNTAWVTRVVNGLPEDLTPHGSGRSAPYIPPKRANAIAALTPEVVALLAEQMPRVVARQARQTEELRRRRTADVDELRATIAAFAPTADLDEPELERLQQAAEQLCKQLASLFTIRAQAVRANADAQAADELAPQLLKDVHEHLPCAATMDPFGDI